MNGNRFSAKRGFTLVEMLVVIAIMSVVATATVNAIRGAQRQARSAKCQANMHSLFKAVAAYRADTEHYPPASGYEQYHPTSDTYVHRRGWVNWVLRANGARSRRNDSGNKYKPKNKIEEEPKTKGSQASSYCYAGTGAELDANEKDIAKSAAYRSIDEGAIFVYADKNPAIYCCDEFKRRYGSQCLRSYAMNQKFRSHRYTNWVLYSTPANANRLAMFVELGWLVDNNGKKRKDNGAKANFNSDFSKKVNSATAKKGSDKYDENKNDVYNDDSVWDWDGANGDGSNGANGENIGVMHMKSGKCYGHVIFADGHLESIALDTKALQEQRKDLGSGSEQD